MLEVSDVTVRFGGLTALDAVSLTAAPRQVTGIIGPNGAGKTTLLNVLCGFVRPDAGRLRFGGAELTGLRPHRLASPRHRPHVAGPRPVPRAHRAGERHDRGHPPRPGRVSGPPLAGAARSDRDERALRDRGAGGAGPGGRRRTWPNACPASSPTRTASGSRWPAPWSREPRLLLLDEPASGLTEGELPELGELISQLAADACVVVVEHRMDLMMSVCDTISVLDFGKLIAFGPPQQVQADPAVTAAYLGVVRQARSRARRATAASRGRARRRRA